MARPVFLKKICAKIDFHSDLDLWPLNPKFVPPIATCVQRYASAKSEVSTAFLFPENRTHGTDANRQTDRQT